MPESTDFRRCPQCGSTVFYAQVGTNGRLVFFRVDREGVIRVRHPEDEGTPLPRTGIGCASCAWEGSVDELVVPVA